MITSWRGLPPHNRDISKSALGCEELMTASKDLGRIVRVELKQNMQA